MKLKQLLNEMNYQVLQGDLNQEVSQIDYDSRTVQDRSLMDMILLIRLSIEAHVSLLLNMMFLFKKALHTFV